MKKHQILFLIIFLWSCKKDGENIKEIVTYDEPIKVELFASDKEILNNAYDSTYSFPKGYYRENNLEGFIYYENTISTRTNEKVTIQLHTNDKNQAKAWSELSNKLSSQYRELLQERETEKYFEFKRVELNNPRGILLSRVHKSSYFVPTIDANTINYLSDEQTKVGIGILNQRPISIETSKHFIEYYLSNWSKVLETKMLELPNWYQYNIKVTELVKADLRGCDKVKVWEYNYFVHKRTGDVYYDRTFIKELEGKCW